MPRLKNKKVSLPAEKNEAYKTDGNIVSEPKSNTLLK